MIEIKDVKGAKLAYSFVWAFAKYASIVLQNNPTEAEVEIIRREWPAAEERAKALAEWFKNLPA